MAANYSERSTIDCLAAHVAGLAALIEFDEAQHRYKLLGEDAVGVSELITSRWHRISQEDFLALKRFESYEDEVETVILWNHVSEQARKYGSSCHAALASALCNEGAAVDDFIAPAYEYVTRAIRDAPEGIFWCEQVYACKDILLCGTADFLMVDTVNKKIYIYDFKITSKSVGGTFLYFANELSEYGASRLRYYSLQLGCYKFLIYESLKDTLNLDEYAFETKLIVLRKDIYKKGGSKSHLQVLDTDPFFTDFAFRFLAELKERKITVPMLLQFL